jgi:hypothetical protein
MPTFRVTGGALTLDSAGLNYPSNELPGSGQIDNSLPGGVPPIGSTLPEPPPGIWPPPSFNHPWAPIPGVGGERPGHDLPTPPSGTLPVRPPVVPGHDLPAVPGTIWPPVNQHPPRDGKFWVVAGIPGTGWRYILVDVTQIIGKPDGKPPETVQPPPTPALKG